VLETPHYARSSAGEARLGDLPAGQLEVHIWHPRLAQNEPRVEQVDLSGDGAQELTVSLELRGEVGSRRAPKRRGRRY